MTTKQLELMRVIAPAPIDMDQILETVRYETTKSSLHFSLRALIKHGLIVKNGTEKRRGRMRRVISATELGKQYANGTPVQAEDEVVSLGAEEALETVPEDFPV